MKTTRWMVGALLVLVLVWSGGLAGAVTAGKVTPPGKALLATNKVAAVAGDPELKEGLNNNVQFPLLPKPDKHPAWMDYNFTPGEETYTVYIPKGLAAGQSCGALGWINPTDGNGIPKQFLALLDEFQLIGVCAARCGNNEKGRRRIGLLACAMLQLGKTYKIDPARRVLSGLSGGGRTAAEGGFVQPEFFSGAISWCGGLFYKNHPNSEMPGKLRGGINFSPGEHLVTTAMAGEAKRKVKFVLLTGPKDSNLVDSRDIKAALDKERYKALLIEVPGLGHQVGEAEFMRQAMVFVLGEPGKP
jgi:predicted esterase